MQKHVIFGFDMETDIGSYLKSYNGVKEGTPKILRIFDTYGIKGTFLFTGDAAKGNPEVVRQVRRSGHEVGCHSLMHETVGEAHFNMPNDAPILEEEAQRRLSMNMEMVEDIIGERPVSFRAPRLWQGHGQVSALNAMGFKADLSYSVAAHKDRILPYHPSKDDWLSEGDLGILEIPNFAFLDDDPAYKKYFGRKDQWPLVRLLGADFVVEHVQSFADRQIAEAGTAVLLFYLHPWEFVPMPGIFEYDEGTFHFKDELHKNCGDGMTAELDKLIGLLAGAGYAFTTAERFVDIWKGR